MVHLSKGYVNNKSVLTSVEKQQAQHDSAISAHCPVRAAEAANATRESTRADRHAGVDWGTAIEWGTVNTGTSVGETSHVMSEAETSWPSTYAITSLEPQRAYTNTMLTMCH